MKKTSKSNLEHLANASKMASKPNHKIAIIGFICVAGIAFIFMMMLSGSKPKPVKVKTPQSSQASSKIFEENMKRIEALRAEADRLKSSVATVKLPARAGAPTAMYIATKKSSSVSLISKNTLAAENIFGKFANMQSSSAPEVSASKLKHPRYTIAQGEFIHAALETAINSELPGMVRAIITRPVYTYLGDKPVIPAGSRLIGQYTSAMNNGMSSDRVFVVWNRVITPSGVSIMINSPGSDELGRSGMGADAIDHHFMQVFGSAILLSVIGAGVSTVGVSPYGQPNSADAYRQAIGSAFQQSAQNSLQQQQHIMPTIHVYQGDPITVFVARDLDLSKVLGE